MVWLIFLLSAGVLVIAAVQLSKQADVIAVRTHLGGAFVGTLMLAGATSLPELLTAINSINLGEPDLAVGTFFGSSIFNMALIGVLDLTYRQGRLLYRAAMSHALTGGVAMLLIGLASFFILAKLGVQIGWVGIDTLIIFLFYLLGAYMIQQNTPPSSDRVEIAETNQQSHPSLRNALIKFALATLVLIFVVPLLVNSSIEIATMIGLTTGFFGTALLALVTSLPEIVATFSALRMRAFDMAIGNLFGGNLFNMFALGIADVFYTQGSLFAALDETLVFAGLLALIMTSMALIGNLARIEKRIAGAIEIDALLLLITYVLGIFLLYQRGLNI